MCKSILLKLGRPIRCRRAVRCHCQQRHNGLHIVQFLGQSPDVSPQLSCCFTIFCHIVDTGEVQIFGRSEIDVDTLLLGFLDPQDAQPVSTWCSRTVNKLLPASPLPVRLASTWLLTKLMRVSPSFPWRRVVANASTVSHLAKCREYECQSGMVDATSREAGDISI